MGDLAAYLAGATVDAAVYGLRADYRAVLVAADGIEPGPSDDLSEALLASAEARARALDLPVEDRPRIAAWRDAYRTFGAKPQRTRNSVEALTRRATSGLPRINRLTDTYNAISVLYEIPLGGEDLDRYSGPPRLLRASGDEPFDTVADGVAVVERPEVGEVVWADDAGVTCRRWNWRQATRTQLRDDTAAALFIIDGLDPVTDDELAAVSDQLIEQVVRMGPQVRVATRFIESPEN